MEVRIEWSGSAEKQLNDIFDYYSLRVSQSVATKVVGKIIDRVEILYKNPFSGQQKSYCLIIPKSIDI
jgi:plasmid stabilization system protein ParE